MTAKERDRLKVLHEISKRHIPQKQAAAELGLSVRWVRQLLVRWRARGRWRAAAWAAWAALEAENAGGGEAASGGTVPGEETGQALA